MNHYCEKCKNKIRFNEVYHTLYNPIRYFCSLKCYKDYINVS